MEFKKKIRCPYCDGKIRIDKEDKWMKSSPYNERTIMMPRVNMPYCASCNRKFSVAIKTEGELEITLED